MTDAQSPDKDEALAMVEQLEEGLLDLADAVAKLSVSEGHQLWRDRLVDRARKLAERRLVSAGGAA